MARTATKLPEVTDEQCVTAAERSQARRSADRTIDELCDMTGMCSPAGKARCLEALERAQNRGLLTPGNPRWAYPTRGARDRLVVAARSL